MDHSKERGGGQTRSTDHPRGSRVHLRQPRTGGKLLISSPVGPVFKNGKSITQESPYPSTAMSYENAYPVKPTSIDIDRNGKENTPPSQHSTIPSKSHNSKSSRALHVLSSITQSFSRSSLSLASFKSSRNFSGASGASSIASSEQKTPKASTSSSNMRRPLIPRFDTQSPGDTQPTIHPTQRADTFQGTTPSPESTSNKITGGLAGQTEIDPKMVYAAQPSAYWTGRFTALRDKYHSELLEPDTLQIVLEEHMRRSTIEEHLVADPVPSNPPKPAPTPRTSISKNDASLPTRSLLKALPSRQPSTLTGIYSSRPPISSGLSRIQITKPTIHPRRQSYDHPPSTRSSFSSSLSTTPCHSYCQQEQPPAPGAPGASGNTAPPPASTLASASVVTSLLLPPTSSTAARRRQVILLTSDDARRARVFAALDSLCATDEAKESLRRWQTAYARSVGKECLLPVGESLVGGRDGGGRRKGSWGSRKSLSLAWKREGSVAGDGGGGAGDGDSQKGGGVMLGRLRMFSGGRRSQMKVLETGTGLGGRFGGSVAEGSVVGGAFGGVASEPGHGPAWAGDGMGQEGGERKMRVKRIRRVEHGF